MAVTKENYIILKSNVILSIFIYFENS